MADERDIVGRAILNDLMRDLTTAMVNICSAAQKAHDFRASVDHWDVALIHRYAISITRPFVQIAVRDEKQIAAALEEEQRIRPAVGEDLDLRMAAWKWWEERHNELADALALVATTYKRRIKVELDRECVEDLMALAGGSITMPQFKDKAKHWPKQRTLKDLFGRGG
jgi:hypothetical protein